MLTFRKKIFLAYLFVFLLFLAAMYPLANSTVQKISAKAMYESSLSLIEEIKNLPNDDAVIEYLKEQKAVVFFRMSVINDQHKILYDSHTKRVLGTKFSQDYVVNHPEVNEAFHSGRGYNEDYSTLLSQKFAYMAIAFDFHGKQYVLRTAFPYKYVSELMHDFEAGVIALATAALMLFSIMTWFIINYLTSPIQQIINAIKPYHEGNTADIPSIKISRFNRSEDFLKLANTLNSLSSKIEKHIKTLTDERNEKEATLEALVEGVIAIDGEMKITYINQTALNLLNLENKSLVNTSFLDYSSKEFGRFHELLKDCMVKMEVLTETMLIKNTHEKIYLDVVAAPKKQNSGAILVLEDKTAHYKLNEMRKDFIANASHELKTPITIIRGFAEMLHDHPELDKEIYAEATNKIVRNCGRMTNLIQDLLTLTDVENIPEFRFTDCSLLDIVKSCTESVKDVRPDAQINIEKINDGDFLVQGDAHLLEHAFLNLIDNAAKYSNAPADIHVFLKNEKDSIEIIVNDKGIGIPEADQEHIFERFYTVDKAHSRKLGGSGLGLSIVETIIHKHFGQITLKSKLGVGTSFTIVLPKNQGINKKNKEKRFVS